MYVCMYVRMYVLCMYVCMHVRMYVYIYMYVCVMPRALGSGLTMSNCGSTNGLNKQR